VSEVANEEDITYNTLYTWLKTVRNNCVTISNSTSLTAEKKLAIMIETGPLTESELAMYCRKNGFYPEQIKAWKDEFLQVAQTKKVSNKASIKETQSDKKEIKKLKKELRRMEKALAKTAALLVLRKKLNALYDLEDEES
jgi:transposase